VYATCRDWLFENPRGMLEFLSGLPFDKNTRASPSDLSPTIRRLGDPTLCDTMPPSTLINPYRLGTECDCHVRHQANLTVLILDNCSSHDRVLSNLLASRRTCMMRTGQGGFHSHRLAYMDILGQGPIDRCSSAVVKNISRKAWG
jgi:hypothetical protein